MKTTSKGFEEEEEKKSSASFEWAIGLSRLSLSILGVWPYTSALVGPSVIFCIILGVTLPQMYALIKVSHRSDLVLDNLPTNFGSLAAISKLLALWLGRETTKRLLDRISIDWLNKSSMDLQTMRLQARRGRLLTITGYCTTIGCLMGFIALPVFRLNIRQLNNITDLDEIRYLPLQAYYPYNVYRSPAYELTYLHQFLAASYTSMAFSVPENFFGVLVFHACAQCEILEERLERLVVRKVHFVEIFRRDLRRIVPRHIRLVRFINDIETLFNLLIAVHMLFLIAIIGFLGLTVVQAFSDTAPSSSLIQVITYAVTALDVMLHTLIYCGTSEMLTSNSCRLFGVIYHPNIYTLPKSCARDLILIMQRLQLPLELTAGKVIVLSLNSYLQFLKNTGGYISMLLTVSQ